ncbi:hypothetical protein CDAR_59911 [Caerostris darwini]|uniref:Uncharacterized protein n=1 Tax=Caerostris darwini TaxID=1538125 RepID=A0AAV4RP86_9ARAC|nr:hypothetical protein CDAR_59911 [Caerostris darwini]
MRISIQHCLPNSETQNSSRPRTFYLRYYYYKLPKCEQEENVNHTSLFITHCVQIFKMLLLCTSTVSGEADNICPVTQYKAGVSASVFPSRRSRESLALRCWVRFGTTESTAGLTETS